jgi:UDP-2-acetamido-3-amino-2,3-dideoxy-glucuronate N-acetyltransferase
MIHKLADCHNLYIPENTNIWQYVVVLPNAKIGEYCNVCAHSFIENDVIIGNNVTIKCGVYLWDGITIDDNVQIGPNVTFTNDKFPRAKQPFKLQRTKIMKNASIGAASVIMGGVIIGENAMIGAGSIVTKDVPANELWFGQPAKFVRKLEI